MKFMRKFKQALALLLMLVMLCSMTVMAQAAEIETAPAAAAPDFDYGIMPLYTYTSSNVTGLRIANGTAYCVATLNGYSNVTKIVITMTLQRKTLLWWSTVVKWSKTYLNSYGTFERATSVTSGNTYRVKAEYKVYSGSNYETITSYSGDYKY